MNTPKDLEAKHDELVKAFLGFIIRCRNTTEQVTGKGRVGFLMGMNSVCQVFQDLADTPYEDGGLARKFHNVWRISMPIQRLKHWITVKTHIDLGRSDDWVHGYLTAIEIADTFLFEVIGPLHEAEKKAKEKLSQKPYKPNTN